MIEPNNSSASSCQHTIRAHLPDHLAPLALLSIIGLILVGYGAAGLMHAPGTLGQGVSALSIVVGGSCTLICVATLVRESLSAKQNSSSITQTTASPRVSLPDEALPSAPPETPRHSVSFETAAPSAPPMSARQSFSEE